MNDDIIKIITILYKFKIKYIKYKNTLLNYISTKALSINASINNINYLNMNVKKLILYFDENKQFNNLPLYLKWLTCTHVNNNLPSNLLMLVCETCNISNLPRSLQFIIYYNHNKIFNEIINKNYNIYKLFKYMMYNNIYHDPDYLYILNKCHKINITLS